MWLLGFSALCVLVACDAHSGPAPTRACTSRACDVGAAQPTARETVVSLTFDDAYENQWLYAVPLLQANHMHGTFYVITADSRHPYPCCMSWAQLRTLQAQGHDIGSHTISHPNLTDISPPRITSEVCGSRQELLHNGIHAAASFAYPFGAYDATAKGIVQRCGFTNAREGGGISPSNTRPQPPYGETLPPKDAYAVRTIAVDGARPIQLAHLEGFVAAASRRGAWLPITFHNVCDTYAADYAHCMSSYGPIDDGVLAQFLAWLQASGQPDGAPGGTVVLTMSQASATWHRVSAVR
jgi:peptidoglycan/xylan/chitin deacetylase (PgdA/CDA1 family)